MSNSYEPSLRCKYSKNMNEIEIINGKAMDEGLSYGQYVAKHGLARTHVKCTVAQKEKKEKEKAILSDTYAKEQTLRKKWWEEYIQ